MPFAEDQCAVEELSAQGADESPCQLSASSHRPDGIISTVCHAAAYPAGWTLTQAAAWYLGLLLTSVTLGIGYIIWSLFARRHGRLPARRILSLRC